MWALFGNVLPLTRDTEYLSAEAVAALPALSKLSVLELQGLSAPPKAAELAALKSVKLSEAEVKAVLAVPKAEFEFIQASGGRVSAANSKLYGKPMASVYDTHFVEVDPVLGYQAADPGRQGATLYDEAVFKNEAQLLPRYIIYFKDFKEP